MKCSGCQGELEVGKCFCMYCHADGCADAVEEYMEDPSLGFKQPLGPTVRAHATRERLLGRLDAAACESLMDLASRIEDGLA